MLLNPATGEVAVGVAGSVPFIRWEIPATATAGEHQTDLQSIAGDLVVTARIGPNGGLRADRGFSAGTHPAQTASLAFGPAETTPVAVAGTGRMRYNQTLRRWEWSEDTGPWHSFAAGGIVIDPSGGGGTTTQGLVADGIYRGAVQLSLAAVDGLNDDTLVWVKSVRRFYRFDPLSVEVSDRIEVVDTLLGPSAPGRWKSTRVTDHGYWSALARTYDPVAKVGGMYLSTVGDPEGDATIGDPIPWAEVERRLAGARFDGFLNQPAFQLVGNVDEDVRATTFSYEYALLRGVPTTAPGGGGLTIASVTTSGASAAGTVNVTSFNFAPFVSGNIFTSGHSYALRRNNHDGTFTRAYIHQGSSGTARIGAQIFENNTLGTPIAGGAQLFQAGDVVDVVQVPHISGHIQSGGRESVALLIQSVDLTGFPGVYAGSLDMAMIGALGNGVFLGGRVIGGIVTSSSDCDRASFTLQGVTIGSLAVGGTAFTFNSNLDFEIGVVANGAIVSQSGNLVTLGTGCHFTSCAVGLVLSNQSKAVATGPVGGASLTLGWQLTTGATVGGLANWSGFLAACTTQATADGATINPGVGPHAYRNLSTGTGVLL